MANEMKDAYYFSHDSNARNDHRIMKLRMDLGMEGYGIYWAIIEMLREQANYTLPIDSIELISYEIRSDSINVEKVINEYNLFKIDQDLFYSQSLKRRMEKSNLLREKRVEAGRKGGLLKQKGSKAKASAKQVLSIKGKESKGKEKKVNNIKAFDEFWILYDKKVSKSNCIKKWNLLSAKDQTDILIALPKYIESTPDKKFRKNPLTYLNQKSWKDEIIQKGSNFDYKSLLSVSHKDIQKYEKN